MPHLASRARSAFAIEMNARARHGQPLGVVLDLGADQIRHFDPSVPPRLDQWPTGDRAHMLLELRHGRPIDGPMAGVVHARRDLVDEQRMPPGLGDHEHLDRQYADIIERRRDCFGDAARIVGDGIGHLGGYARELEDVVAMLVLDQIEALDPAVARACGNDRDLSIHFFLPF